MQASAANPCLESRHRRCRFHKIKGYPAGTNTQAGARCKQMQATISAKHPFSNLQTPPNAVAARVRPSQRQLGGSFTAPVDLGRQFCDPSRPREAVLRQKSTSGGGFATGIDLGRRFCDRNRPREAVLRPKSTSGGSFATEIDLGTVLRQKSTSGGSFATPVKLERRFCDGFATQVDLRRRFCDKSTSGGGFATPVGLWRAVAKKKCTSPPFLSKKPGNSSKNLDFFRIEISIRRIEKTTRISDFRPKSIFRYQPLFAEVRIFRI